MIFAQPSKAIVPGKTDRIPARNLCGRDPRISTGSKKRNAMEGTSAKKNSLISSSERSPVAKPLPCRKTYAKPVCRTPDATIRARTEIGLVGVGGVASNCRVFIGLFFASYINRKFSKHRNFCRGLSEHHTPVNAISAKILSHSTEPPLEELIEKPQPNAAKDCHATKPLEPKSMARLQS